MLCLHVYMYTPGAHRGQRRVLEPLELWLEMLVSSHIGAVNKPGSAVRVTSALNS